MVNLLEMRDRVLTIPAFEKRAVFVGKEIQEAEDDVAALLSKYEKESRGVERLQRDSLSSFLLQLAGRYDDKLEKRQREEIYAKLEYDMAVTHLGNLMRERDGLAAEILALQADERVYLHELKNRRLELGSKLMEPDGIRYAELEQKRSVIIANITETKHALRAAAAVKATAGEVLSSLENAEGWATFEVILGGGLISHLSKYSHIDEAERSFHTLSSQLRELRLELGDVHGLAIPGLTEISSSQRAIDFWFDNIFTNWSVRSQIKDNVEQIHQLQAQIDSIESALRAALNSEEAELAANKRREEELLLTISH
ncbi:MAG: hypothetical protein FWE20_00895 [Defluviitaleaceae bacterium]|nr:hypothetical protein [Defluviitaleaceae bacterium]